LTVTLHVAAWWLLTGARVSVVVDASEPLQQLAATAAQWSVTINVLVEINAGQDR